MSELVVFLRLVVSSEGGDEDLEKVKPIVDWPKPTYVF